LDFVSEKRLARVLLLFAQDLAGLYFEKTVGMLGSYRKQAIMTFNDMRFNDIFYPTHRI